MDSACFTTYFVNSSHPDKYKLVGNDTAETVANKFVELTKAYKSCVSSIFA